MLGELKPSGPQKKGNSHSFQTKRKQFFCGSFLRNGEVFAYAERNQNLKDLKDRPIASHQFAPYSLAREG